MNQLSTLIRRELWEHKATFLVLPAVVTGVFTAVLLILLVGLYTDAVSVDMDLDVETHNEQREFILRDSSLMDLFGTQLKKLEAQPDHVIEEQLNNVYTGTSVIWFAILWVVVFFYLLSALYDERKDRSILFWKSMPVSDWLTVASKLGAGLIVAPAIYLFFIVVAHLILITLASFAAIGQDIDIWKTLWSSANLVTRWLGFVGLYGFTLLWCLPFFAWLLMVSSWAKSAPLAWAVGIPIVLVLLEGMLIDTQVLGTFIRQHTFSFEFWQHGRDLMNQFELAEALELMVTLVVGMAFLGGAVWFRGKADEM